MNYSEKLTSPKWQKKRLLILERDKFTCQLCSDQNTTLHIHHLKYTGEPWEANDLDLQTLCSHCHSLVEFFNKHDDLGDPLLVGKIICPNGDLFVNTVAIVNDELSVVIGKYFGGQYQYVLSIRKSSFTSLLELIRLSEKLFPNGKR